MVMAEIGILNVGTGDTKITFDPNNPAEMARSARIVEDMLRRGYALLVEVERNGEKAFERVREFRPESCEYIIADFDSEAAAVADAAEAENVVEGEGEATPAATAPRARRTYKTRATRAIPASGARGVAVARSAGG